MIVSYRSLHYSTERGLNITDFVPMAASVSRIVDIPVEAVPERRVRRSRRIVIAGSRKT